MSDILFCKQIWDEYKEKVSAYLKSHISNESDREDLLSLIFTKIVQYQDSYRGNQKNASSFVFTITRNTVIDFYRTTHTSYELSDILEASSEIEEDILNTEILDQLSLALNKLQDHERGLIVMHYYDGLSLHDISKKMNLSYGKTKLLHTRVLLKLRNDLKHFA